MDIKLNFVNESSDRSNSQVVIFQKNVATGFDELAVAWKVIENCGLHDNHPFSYPLEFEVGARDAWGNYLPRRRASTGELYSILKDNTGHVLKYTGNASVSTEVQIRNDLKIGSVSADIYKDGRLLATKRTVAPSQKAVFKFKPRIFIGVASEVEEGEIMDSAVISDINTEISLIGIRSADIVMTGGGSGESATPFRFELANVKML